MDRFEAMQMFKQVVEYKSFTRAADHLYLPKATVSKAIRSLETHLGVQLLQRTTRRVNVTPEGQAFYRRCEFVLAELEDMETMFREESRQIRGTLRVDMTLPLARHMIIPALPRFLEQYPLLTVELGSNDSHANVIQEGIDCVIRAGEIKDTRLASERLGDMHLVTCGSASYIQKYGHPRCLKDLDNHYLIRYMQHFDSSPEGFEYFNGKQYKEYPMKSLISVNAIDAYHAACVAGLGLMQCPEIAVKESLEKGHLVRVMTEFQSAPMPMSLAYPKRLLPRRVKVFLEWVRPLVIAYLSP